VLDLRPTHWIIAFQALILVLALGALFRLNLLRLWQIINPVSGDPAWGHAVFVPLVSLAYLLHRRAALRAITPRPARAGVGVLLGGIAIFAYGIGMDVVFPGRCDAVQDVGMVVTFYGVVLALFGWGVGRLAIFPIAYLLCAIPWPPSLFEMTTGPLRHLAATLAVGLLRFTPLNVEQAGNTIHVVAMSGPDRVLDVADACAGMRSLVLFIAVGLAVAFLPERRLWKSIVIALSAVPIAIACNVMRIAGEALLDHYVSRTWSEGFYHAFAGVVLLAPGFVLFLLLGWMLGGTSPPKQAPIAGKAPKANRLSARTMYAVVVTILALSAGAFTATAHALQLHFQKLPVPLPAPLTDLPMDLGPWHAVAPDRPLPADVQATLGTDQYVFREYLDERVEGRATIDALKNRPDRDAAIGAIASARPNACAHLAVTYFTGRVDTVSHVPELCYVAGGEASSTESASVQWNVAGRPLAVRLVRIDPLSRTAGVARYVAYCYRVNGHAESEPWRVRSRLANLFERDAWYAKIEVMAPVADANEAARVLADFLSAALPEIERRLPSSQVERRASP
jgi:exosortase